MDGWAHFAEIIVKDLREYDRLNKTEYAYFLESYAVKVLADIMRKADKELQWEPIQQQKPKEIN